MEGMPHLAPGLASILLRLQQQQHLLTESTKRAAEPLDQPLDLALGMKKACHSPTDSGYNLSLGSLDATGNRSGSISPSGSHRSDGSSGAGPNTDRSSSPAGRKPEGLLTTVPPYSHLAVRPLASLTRPVEHDMKPVLPLQLPFAPSLPFPFHPASFHHFAPSPAAPYSSDLEKINMCSQMKFEDFRSSMLKNIEQGQDTVKAEAPPSEGRGSPDSLNQSLPISLSLTPTTSTPRVAKDGNEKDSSYWERRRKNNAAAKRSRDTRRAKEQDIAIRAQYLENENNELKLTIVRLQAELMARA
jgi:bZIP factor